MGIWCIGHLLKGTALSGIHHIYIADAITFRLSVKGHHVSCGTIRGGNIVATSSR